MSLIERDVRQFASDKIINKEHIGRVAEWVKGRNVFPITVELDMTDKCQHFCNDCVGGRVGGEQIQPAVIINQLAELGCKGITFTGGGEPLLHKETLNMVEYAKDRKIDVGFITNGSALTKEKSERLVKNCTWVRVSLDAGNAETFKYTHGLPVVAFNKVVKNIKGLAEMKSKVGSECTVGVGYLTDEITKSGMLEATRLARDLGVDYVQFRPYHRDETEVNDEIEKCLEYETENFKVLWSKHKYESMKRGDWGRTYEKCYGQQFATVIGANGKMYLCCHMRGMEKYELGDVNKQTIKDIWNSERRQEVIDGLDWRDCPPLCRANTFNQILWEIKQNKDHVNFL